MSGELIVAIVSVIVTLVLVFLTPIGEYFVTRRFLGAPLFSLSSHTLDRNLLLRLTATNRKARRRKALGLETGGVIVFPAAPSPVRCDYTWMIDLKDHRLIDTMDRIGDNLTLTVRFFHELGDYSDEYRLFFPPDLRELIHPLPEITEFEANSAIALVEHIGSHRIVKINFDKDYIPFAPFLRNSHASWTEVEDGMELVVRDVERFTLRSERDSTLLSKASYAWVMAFDGCRSISIDSCVFGHEVAGQCTGGVLKINKSEDIVVRGGRLFGCGTHGFELVSVKNVVFSDLEIHDCTFGLGVVNQSTRVIFRNCTIRHCGQYNFIEVLEILDDITFYDCHFFKNDARHGLFVKFDNISNIQDGRVRFINCQFLENDFPRLSNMPDVVAFHDCTFDAGTARSPWQASVGRISKRRAD